MNTALVHRVVRTGGLYASYRPCAYYSTQNEPSTSTTTGQQQGTTQASPRSFSQEDAGTPSSSSPSSSTRPSSSSSASSPSSSPSTSSASSSTGPPPSPPKVIVFGGRGFVGSHICEEAVKQGLEVVSFSKSGTPPLTQDSWITQVEWVRGNALEPQSYMSHLEGAAAAISCVGGFGTYSEMLKVNGTANVAFIEAAQAAGIPRLVFISAHVPVRGMDHLAELVMGGYIKGKAQAEEAVQQCFPSTGVILRPGIIYGNRAVSRSLTLPLHVAFRPVEVALSFLPTRQLARLPLVGAAFTPPCSVRAVARAALHAALDPSVPPGVMDVWEINKYRLA